MPLLAQMGSSEVACIPAPKKVVRRRLLGRSDVRTASILHVRVPIPSSSTHPSPPTAPPINPPVQIPLVVSGDPTAAAAAAAAEAAESADVSNATDAMSTISNASSDTIAPHPSVNRGFDEVD